MSFQTTALAVGWFDGEAINLSKTLPIKNALQNFGIEHYYKAKMTQTILYVEGSTDIEMLKAFAEWLDHPAKTVLTDKLNKGRYYELIKLMPKQGVENEVIEKLDILVKYLKHRCLAEPSHMTSKRNYGLRESVPDAVCHRDWRFFLKY
ncbi:MAG: hypothetical protein VSS75_027860 [Candidatus Parabeggiatoa sp.]|nr:hypothetical protein [Candidatus Parabeggiatoa sp.]